MIKVVLIGCGNITNLRHIPAVKSLKRNGLVISGVIGIKEENVQKSKNLANTKNSFVGETTLSNCPDWLKEADLIIIGTPPHTHLKVLSNVLELNQRAKVIVEKPFSLGASDTPFSPQVILNEHRIFVMHNFQFAGGFSKALEWIRDGRIGNVVSVSGFQSSTKDRRLPDWHEELPAGLFWDEAIHFYYLLERLLGELEVVGGLALTIDKLNTPANLSINLIGARNIPIQINMNFSASFSEWGVIISGSEGSIIYDFFRDIPIIIPHDGQHLAIDILKTSFSFIQGHIWGFGKNGFRYIAGRLHYGIDEVIKRVAFFETQPDKISGINFKSGLRMVKLMDQSVKYLRDNSTNLK